MRTMSCGNSLRHGAVLVAIFLTTNIMNAVDGHGYIGYTHSELSDCKPQKLLVILVDGVRYDYPNRTWLTGFQMMADHGVRAEYVTPTFPSNSYPNWYTIATGLYAESHGIVQNYMYDASEEDLFMMGPNPSTYHPHWWNYAEPVWVTAEKHGITSALYWWDGCQVNIRGKKPTFCVEYRPPWRDVNSDAENVMHQILDRFEKDQLGLGMLYYEEVDANGHAYGPEAEMTETAMRNVDSLLTKLQYEVMRRKLEDQVNIMVVSDHGMISTQGVKVIDIARYIDLKDVLLMLDRGSMAMIVPHEGKEYQILSDLQKADIEGLKFYRKPDIPERYHYRCNHRIHEILLVAEKGYYIRPLMNPTKMNPYDRGYISPGIHGYDPYIVTEMRAIMYARGPVFKKGYVSPPLEMVDHYNLMCHILQLEPLPNNGSWHRVKDMLLE